MDEFTKVADYEDIKEGQITLVKVENEEIALFKLGETIFATSNLCTHEECPLDENNLIDGEEVECTCHGSRFNIKTGVNTAPPAAIPLPVYKTKIEKKEVYLKLR